MLKKCYLAYGSNLNLEHMAYRCPSAKVVGTTILENHRLVYKGRADDFAYLTIEKYEGKSVPLGIFEVSHKDISSLDIYEGYPELYKKEYIPVKLGDETKKVLIYIMNQDLTYHLPSEEYIESCMTGYEYFGFNKKILEQALLDTKVNLPKRLFKC